MSLEHNENYECPESYFKDRESVVESFEDLNNKIQRLIAK